MTRQIINIADLDRKVAKRGRKSTVTEADIEEARTLSVGEAIHIEEASTTGDEFADYRASRIARYNGDEQALLNAWQSRHRQRVAALAKASEVDLVAVFTTDGEMYAARQG